LEKAIRKVPDQLAPIAVINHPAMEEVRVGAKDLPSYLDAEANDGKEQPHHGVDAWAWYQLRG
jgi:hypothetical protein